MWGWVWNLRKCFGNGRENTPGPEDDVESQLSAPGTPAHGALPVQSEHSSLPRLEQNSAAAQASAPAEPDSAGTPGKQPASSSIMDTVSSPQIHVAASVPAMRASPMLQQAERSGLNPQQSPEPRSPVGKLRPGRTRTRSPPVIATMSLIAVKSPTKRAGEGSYSAQHLNTARIAKVTRSTSHTTRPRDSLGPPGKHRADSLRQHEGVEQPQATATAASNTSSLARKRSRMEDTSSPSYAARQTSAPRPSRLSVQTPVQNLNAARRQYLGSEEQPLTVHHTPFDVRLERQLQEIPPLGQASSMTTDPRPVGWQQEQMGMDAARKLPRSTSPKRRPESSHPLDASITERAGKENSEDPSTGKASSLTGSRPPTGSARAAEPTQLGSVLKPKTQLYVPDANNPFGSMLQTPSPTHLPRFVLDTDESFGSPNVVGIENLTTQYREDKHLRVHETPFEQRVEQFIETERAWKERQRLSVERGDLLNG